MVTGASRAAVERVNRRMGEKTAGGEPEPFGTMGGLRSTPGKPESPLMLTPTELYPLLERLLQSSRLISHATARTAVARLLATLLVAQDLRPSAVIRILPAPCARAARHRFGSVRRALHRPWLAPPR